MMNLRKKVASLLVCGVLLTECAVTGVTAFADDISASSTSAASVQDVSETAAPANTEEPTATPVSTEGPTIVPTGTEKPAAETATPVPEATEAAALPSPQATAIEEPLPTATLQPQETAEAPRMMAGASIPMMLSGENGTAVDTTVGDNALDGNTLSISGEQAGKSFSFSGSGTVVLDEAAITAVDAAAISVSGNVNIVVNGSCKVQGAVGFAGISVPEGAEVSISGGTENAALLAVGNAGSEAGIDMKKGGAGIGGNAGQNSGKITISNLAAVSAYGYGIEASGIGTCQKAGRSGDIEIENVKNLTVQGGCIGQSDETEGGCGIGGGGSGSDIGKIYIHGCDIVSAVGGPKGCGIGSAFWQACAVTVENCGSVTAKGGFSSAAIGTGRNPGGDLSVNSAADYSSSIVLRNIASLTAVGGGQAAAIGTGYLDRSYGDFGRAALDTVPETSIAIEGCTVTATGGKYAAGIGGGYKGFHVSVSIDAASAVTAYAGEAGSSKPACAIGAGANGSGLFADNGATVSIADGAKVYAYGYGYEKAGTSSTENGQTTSSSALQNKWPVSTELNATGSASVMNLRFLTSDFYSEGEKYPDPLGVLTANVANTVRITNTAGNEVFAAEIPAPYTSFALALPAGHYYLYLNGQLMSTLPTLASTAYSAEKGTAYGKQDTEDVFAGAYAQYGITYKPNAYNLTQKIALDAPSADFEIAAGVNAFDAVAYRGGISPRPLPTATAAPTATATAAPTATPAATATAAPTATSTAAPTTMPTATHTAAPTATSTAVPTAAPTAETVPTITAAPTAAPTTAPVTVPRITPPRTPSRVSVAAVTAAPQVTAVPVQDDNVPAAAGDTESTDTAADEGETIEDEAVPLAGGPKSAAWALVNLILTVLTVLACLFMLVRGIIGKRKKDADDAEDADYSSDEKRYAKYDRKMVWKLFSIVPAVVAVIAFIFTEDMRLPMILIDRWTLLMLVIALVQVLVLIMAKRKKEKPEEEDSTGEEAE